MLKLLINKDNLDSITYVIKKKLINCGDAVALLSSVLTELFFRLLKSPL